MGHFGLYSKYYDLLYRDKNYGAEAEYVYETLSGLNPDIKNVCELGCGTGNHAQHLVQYGWNIAGIEQSEEMVAVAREKAINGFYPKVGDITTFLVDGKMDACISLFHVISYLNSNEEVNSCFKQVNLALKNEGLFMFDVWFTPAVYSLKPETRIKRMENDDIQVTRLAESDIDDERNIVTVNYEIQISDKKLGGANVIKEKHPMRHFSIPELLLYGKINGFEMVKAEEFGTGNLPSANTWGVCFVFRKIKNM